MSERTIFLEALDKDDVTERSAFLDTACAGDEALRRRVDALLKSHVEAGDFMGKLAPARVAEELALEHTANDTQGENENDKADASLDFLAPSDKPDILGRFAHYDILEVIGRGGMGIVLRAFDEKLHRVVAIKVMAAQLATNAIARKRFRREAQAAAAVSHDHIVTIHAVDEANGLPYLVMHYVAGVSLQERLDKSGPLQLQKILRIGMQTASGLAAAHGQGLIHRDIKPSNILLENGIERVQVTDFGLARAATEASLTQSGVVAGTPQYMSPEQAEGKAIDQRSDLFSLGSVLYAMCTGRAPFRASGTMAILKRVCEETPRPIREANPEVPDWLVAIIEKLHAKDPAARYQTAAEVAELLNQHLAHLQHPSIAPLPVSSAAKPLSVWRRRRVVAAVALLSVVAGLSLTEATGVTNFRAALKSAFTPDGAVTEVDHAADEVGEVRRFEAQTGWVGCVAFSPSGKQVAYGGEDSTVWLCDAATGKLIRRFAKHEHPVFSVAFSSDGHRLLSGGQDATMRLWDIETGKEIRCFEGHTAAIWGVALSPDGRHALSGSGWLSKDGKYSPGVDGTARLWDVETGQELRRFPGHKDYVISVAFSPDGKRALTGAGNADPIIRLWDVETANELGRLEGHSIGVNKLVFSTDGSRALSASSDKTIRLWDVASGRQLEQFHGHRRDVSGVAFLPDRKRIISCSWDKTVCLWNLETGLEIHRFEGHTESIRSLAVSPDGHYAVSGGEDGTVRLWKLPKAGSN